MTEEQKIAFKNRLKLHCLEVMEQRIAASKTIINNAQEAANQEEKSSAGDKYETARAMSHLEKDMHTRQLAGHQNELAAILAIDTNVICNKVVPGAFVTSTEAVFFIAAGLGKQLIDGQTIWILSPQAPLSRLLLQKQAGDHFQFNNKSLTITEVF